MDYLGSKTSLAPAIVGIVRSKLAPGATVADLFAGTGAVSEAFASAGYLVEANDQLPLSVAVTRARLSGNRATFGVLADELGPLGTNPQHTVLRMLNALPGEEGWITRNYSPKSFELIGIERRYLTVENSLRVDAIRHKIRSWRSLLTVEEHAVLVTALVRAVSRVSNVAGTYGAYLKRWKNSALRPIQLQPVSFAAMNAPHSVTCRDAEEAAAESAAEVAYADPPYTKRQYAAYYHLLNSIATDDESALSGNTGLPNWRPLASEWCYKRMAPDALERLVAKSGAPLVLLSYSSDGHIAHDTIRDVLARFGRVGVHEFERRRYRSSSQAHLGPSVIERVYTVQR